MANEEIARHTMSNFSLFLHGSANYPLFNLMFGAVIGYLKGSQPRAESTFVINQQLM